VANQEQLAILKDRGVKYWNEWRTREMLHDASAPDLSGADLRNMELTSAELYDVNLTEADLTWAYLGGRASLARANLTNANLTETFLERASLTEANLTRANLARARLKGANLTGATFKEATLRGADLREVLCLETAFDDADLTGCYVYGLSAWGISATGAKQNDLVITPDSPTVTVDNLAVAQFMYLLLNNATIRDVIDTITSKVVLILGRFTPERKSILDALRKVLRETNYSPIVFDFEKPMSRDLTETIRMLAGLARFVIADITDAKSIPQELMAIVPDLPSVPVQPLLLSSQQQYGMFGHFRRYPWVLNEVLYETTEQLLENLEQLIILPAEAKIRECRELPHNTYEAPGCQGQDVS
jgi:uncharacterized protein YjbI with pentapeptide repeats